MICIKYRQKNKKNLNVGLLRFLRFFCKTWVFSKPFSSPTYFVNLSLCLHYWKLRIAQYTASAFIYVTGTSCKQILFWFSRSWFTQLIMLTQDFIEQNTFFSLARDAKIALCSVIVVVLVVSNRICLHLCYFLCRCTVVISDT